MRLHNARVHRRRLGNLGLFSEVAYERAAETAPPSPPPPVVAPTPAPVETVVATAPSGAPVVVTQPLAEPTLPTTAALPVTAPPAPAPIAASAIAPPSGYPSIVRTEAPAQRDMAQLWYAGYTEQVDLGNSNLAFRNPITGQYAAWPTGVGIVPAGTELAPQYMGRGYTRPGGPAQPFTITIAPDGGILSSITENALPIALVGSIFTLGLSAPLAAAPAAVESAAPYLTAAELAPIPESVITPTVAASSALPPEAFAASLAETPIPFTEAAIPETVISELPAGITPDSLAVSSPITAGGTAQYPAISEEFFTPTAPAAMEFAPVPESVITPTTPEYLLPQEMAPAPQEYPPISEQYITPTEPAVPLMPAAVPESPATLSEWGMTETAPGVFEAAPAEYPPISEQYITPTTPAGEPGVPSTWYAATPSGGAAVPGASEPPAGGAGEPGASGGGAPPGGVANAIKGALERFFAPRSTAPIATHPQTLLEAAGQYAAENPIPGFAMAVALGVAIVGARAAMKH